MKTLLVAFACLAALWLSWRWFETAMIFIPSREQAAHPGSLGLAYEDVTLRAPGGPTLHGWWVPLSERAPVVLFCHGNGGNIGNRLDKLKILRSAGASVLLFDYRGYGKSSGWPSERGVYDDAEAFYKWLNETKHVAPERIVAYGESLGGAIATELALRRRVGALVLDSAFTNIDDMARIVFPRVPLHKLVNYHFDTLGKLGNVRVPVLIMHSPQDDIVPYALGRRLFGAANEPKTFFELKGGHNGGFIETGPAYEEALRRFLRRRSQSG